MATTALAVLLAVAAAAVVRAADGDLDPSLAGSGVYVEVTNAAGDFTVKDQGAQLSAPVPFLWSAADYFASGHSFAFTAVALGGGTTQECFFTPPFTTQAILTGGALDASGRLVLVGSAKHTGDDHWIVVVARFSDPIAGCAVDGSFGATGPGYTYFDAGDIYIDRPRIVVDRSGAIDLVATIDGDIVHGKDILVMRITGSGGFDGNFPSFKTIDFVGRNDFGQAIAVSEAPPGTFHLWVAGSAKQAGSRLDSDTFIAELSTSGVVEHSLAVDAGGSMLEDEATAIAVDAAHHQIYVAGLTQFDSSGTNTARAELLRLTDSGELDSAFSSDGVVLFTFAFHDATSPSQAVAVAVQTDGKPVVAGNVNNGDFAAARFNTFGGLDVTFNPPTGRTVVPTGSGGVGSFNAATSLFMPDGRIWLGGYTTHVDHLVPATVRLVNALLFDDGFEGGLRPPWK